jgi:hypothetical protein
VRFAAHTCNLSNPLWALSVGVIMAERRESAEGAARRTSMPGAVAGTAASGGAGEGRSRLADFDVLEHLGEGTFGRVSRIRRKATGEVGARGVRVRKEPTPARVRNRF